MKKQLLFGVLLFALNLIPFGMRQGMAQDAAETLSPPPPFLHPLFTSHMVLQRDADDPVWGWAKPGAQVTVETKNEAGNSVQAKTAVAGQDGRWQVTVGPFAKVPGNKPYSLIITAENQAPINLTDILIGDVWLCSGQSNMDRSLMTYRGLPDILNQNAEIQDTINFPQIREYFVSNLASATPHLVPAAIGSDPIGKSGPWLVNNPTNASGYNRYSAVAYFFARELTQKLGVPIGILQSSWGGTTIQAWIDPETLAKDPDFASAAAQLPNSKPTNSSPGAIYNGKVAPTTPFKIKGVVWYQGENNSNAPQQYVTLLPLLLQSWRSNFGEPNCPFIVIQLPNFINDNWPIIREAQLDTVLKDANTRLAVTIDLGDPKQLHPPDKQDVAHRAALAALNLVYGQTLVYSGPMFSKATIQGNAVTCTFDQVGAGLMVGQRDIPPKQPLAPTIEVPDGVLTGFELAGSDGHFSSATAKITGKDDVEVSSPDIIAPVAVRYAWAGAPTCNLYNKIEDNSGQVIDGLPASPFRTHD